MIKRSTAIDLIHSQIRQFRDSLRISHEIYVPFDMDIAERMSKNGVRAEISELRERLLLLENYLQVEYVTIPKKKEYKKKGEDKSIG